MQHAPFRKTLCDFDQIPMPTPESEIKLIQTFAETAVIGLTINHEGMTDTQITKAIIDYERDLGIPVTDALTRSPDLLAEMVLRAFPEIERKVTAGAA